MEVVLPNRNGSGKATYLYRLGAAAQDCALASPVTGGPHRGQNSKAWERLKDHGGCSAAVTNRTMSIFTSSFKIRCLEAEYIKLLGAVMS